MCILYDDIIFYMYARFDMIYCTVNEYQRIVYNTFQTIEIF